VRRSHIDRRSRRYAARQFVSDYETQEEKPMSDISTALPRTKGTVKFFDIGKGFGFCVLGEGKQDVFLHANACKRSGLTELPKQGDELEFDVVLAAKGPKADNIRLLARA
jgi:CspA family cold shock protein